MASELQFIHLYTLVPCILFSVVQYFKCIRRALTVKAPLKQFLNLQLFLILPKASTFE